MRKFPGFFLIIIVFVLWSLIQWLISFYPEILWFDNLGFSSVFWTNLSAKVLTGLVFGVSFFVLVGLNVFIARYLGKNKPADAKREGPDVRKFIEELFGDSEAGGFAKNFINVTPGDGASRKRSNLFWGIGIGFVALLTGFSAVMQWPMILKALNATSFGVADPIFARDIGFYIFSLPLLKFVQAYVSSALFLSLAACIWIYLLDGNISFTAENFLRSFPVKFNKGVKAHLSIILAAMTLVFAWGLWLGELEILYSARGVVFGAGYTDVNAQLLGYNLQIAALVLLAGLFLVSILQRGVLLPVIGLVVYFIVAVFMGGAYPALVQNLKVKPSEISLEAPYIENGIKYTRLAYGLDKIEEQPFAAAENLSLRDINRNSPTVSNIRLWDTRPLIKTYSQLQGIRLYYDFSDVDVDRYMINGKYEQVMLSPREMRVEKLPEKARTWINQHLKFTHGYGACLSPVNKKTSDGLPDLIVKDIPPVTKTDLKIDRPEIYYGEETDNYVIVNTKEQEFDYPKGDKNVYARYQGKGGIEISSFLRKLAFAIKFSDTKILLTNYITNKSRLMFDRSIRDRVAKIAPFLTYDRDPYLVITKGKLFWIQDAYTLSNLYPYSEPSGNRYGRFNYIRNSIKVTVDAYSGEVAFYLVDENDPIAKTYQKIYPTLIKPFAQMPDELKKHIRYPYDLFMVQAQKYSAFHMQDAQVFYNQEDLWNVPKEIYESSEQLMDAYYTIMRLPKEKKEEFLLMLPFTPNNKANMIAWLAARSDVPNYGKLVVYKFPKDKLVYGPMQIEARIDQQTEISQQFTLWGQGGSKVIRGNLLAIPIEQSIVYVEPVYLEAATGALPELKRVIVSYGKNVAMAETLEQALSAVFSGRVTTTASKTVSKTKHYLSPKQLAAQALKLYDSAKSNLRQGNFGSFGEKFEELKKVLTKIAK